MHDAARDTKNGRARFGAKDIGIGDIQVVARDGNIEIVLERQRDRVVQRKVELAIVHQRVDARGVGQIRWGQAPGSVGADRVGKVRHRLSIVQDRQRLPRRSVFRCRSKRLGFRRVLRGGSRGRILGPTRESQRCKEAGSSGEPDG